MAIDWGVILDLKETDPCAGLRQLRIVRLEMASTGTVQKISFRDRETWFSPGDGKILDNIEREFEAACAAKEGRALHFAITLGPGPRCGCR
ncbi:hypothetical protein [Microvirga brassicacearum]|uniref:Uncharacterized protein n=1 Tax=Microvirga brassicacearum TaxID=2580413 RepID=A0A5N3PH56_9HYPH|nr:hypothetical protein [Microvirga brassicacearum]KAB0269057.1 hypothetical protein FEZ63_02820 [Microvirga brassicacearum]